MGTHKSNPRCRQIQESLSAYVEGDLTAPESHRIAAHIDSCLDCRGEERVMRQAVGVLTAPREAAPHGDLYIRFEAKLAESMQPRWFQRPTLRWAGSLACLLLVVGVGATVVQQRYSAKQPDAVVLPDNRANGSNNAPIFGNGRSVPLEAESGQSHSANARIDNVILPENPKNEIASNSNSAFVPKIKRTSKGKFEHSNPTNFMEVRDADGMTARDRMEAAHQNSNDVMGGIPKNISPQKSQFEVHRAHIPGAPRVTVIATESDDRTPVGNGTARVRTDTGYDSNGDLALIRIQADTSHSTDPVRPSDDNSK